MTAIIRFMRWHVHSERPIYKDQWLDIRSADIELPDGRHLDHRIIYSAPGAGAVVTNQGAEVLLLWRHRFITDTWGYEIPLGRIDPGEEPIDAAARECEEETGWRPGPLRPLIYIQPSNGIMTSQHHIFYADNATSVGPATEGFEADHIEWVPLYKIPTLISEQKIVSGTTVAALLFAITEQASHSA